jgi:hypothetical protein
VRGYADRRVAEDETPDARRREAIGRRTPKPLRTIWALAILFGMILAVTLFLGLWRLP